MPIDQVPGTLLASGRLVHALKSAHPAGAIDEGSKVNSGLNTPTRRKPGPADAGRGIEKAVNELADYFTGGDFTPGDPLPAQAKLAKDFGLSLYAVRQALTQLRDIGVITTVKGGYSHLTEARPKHTLTRDFHDPTRHLRPTGPAQDLWRPASQVTAELFAIHERAPLHVKIQLCEHLITGLPVHTVRTVPADLIADIEPDPDPYGERADLIAAFGAIHGPLSATERHRVIRTPTGELRNNLALEPGAPALEHRRLTRSATGKLLMIESEITDGTAAEWEYPL